MYGSRWLTAGQGSVLMLWGEPGDLVVELRHLKQPVEDVGALTLLHDHARGVTVVHDQIDLLVLAHLAKHGLSVHDAAVAMTSNPYPSKNEIEKARRKLEGFLKTGLVIRMDNGTVALYYPPETGA